MLSYWRRFDGDTLGEARTDAGDGSDLAVISRAVRKAIWMPIPGPQGDVTATPTTFLPSSGLV